MARAAWREPNLPAASLNEPTRQLRLLVDHRDDLVAERTRVQSRLRWDLHEIDPTLEVRPKGLRCQRVVMQVTGRLAEVAGTVAEIARELLTRCAQLNQRINELEAQIKQLVDRQAPSERHGMSGPPTPTASGSTLEPGHAGSLTDRSTQRSTASPSPKLDAPPSVRHSLHDA